MNLAGLRFSLQASSRRYSILYLPLRNTMHIEYVIVIRAHALVKVLHLSQYFISVNRGVFRGGGCPGNGKLGGAN